MPHTPRDLMPVRSSITQSFFYLGDLGGRGVGSSPLPDYVIRLWEKPVDVLSMCNSVTDYDFLLFVYRNPDSVLTNADLVFSWITFHLLKVSEIERIITYEIFKDRLLCLSLNTLRKSG